MSVDYLIGAGDLHSEFHEQTFLTMVVPSGGGSSPFR